MVGSTRGGAAQNAADRQWPVGRGRQAESSLPLRHPVWSLSHISAGRDNPTRIQQLSRYVRVYSASQTELKEALINSSFRLERSGEPDKSA
jgi:hypothetical protein